MLLDIAKLAKRPKRPKHNGDVPVHGFQDVVWEPQATRRCQCPQNSPVLIIAQGWVREVLNKTYLTYYISARSESIHECLCIKPSLFSNRGRRESRISRLLKWDKETTPLTSSSIFCSHRNVIACTTLRNHPLAQPEEVTLTLLVHGFMINFKLSMITEIRYQVVHNRGHGFPKRFTLQGV